MFYFPKRCFASVLIVFVLLFSLCAVQPARVAARSRCPVEIPDSLLTLYLKSDLIVVATVENERFVKTVEEYDSGASFEVEKTLRISDTLKGRHSDLAAFREINYKSSQGSEDGAEAAPNVGGSGQALFFLTRNEEDNFLWLADDESGMKSLADHELNIYVERIAELKLIQASRKNQLGRLAEWLVRLAEEPITRAEGLLDLQASFRALEYEREEEETGAAKTKKAVVLDKDFRAENTPEIAGRLTDSQKRRLTDVLLAAVNDDLRRLNDASSEGEITPDYALLNLIGNWDKPFLAMTAFALLRNAGDANRFKAIYLLDTITQLLADEELYEISIEYQAALAANEAAPIESPEVKEAEAILPKSETPTEIENAAKGESAEQIVQTAAADVEAPEAIDETAEKLAAQTTNRELRETLFAKFVRQYGAVISQLPSSK